MNRGLKYALLTGLYTSASFVTLDLILNDQTQFTLQKTIASFIAGATFMYVFFHAELKKKLKDQKA